MATILLTALAAGMVSTVNPCGFAMLPAYLGYFLGESGGGGVRRVGAVAASVAAGFLAVFSIAGVVISVGMRALVTPFHGWRWWSGSAWWSPDRPRSSVGGSSRI